MADVEKKISEPWSKFEGRIYEWWSIIRAKFQEWMARKEQKPRIFTVLKKKLQESTAQVLLDLAAKNLKFVKSPVDISVTRKNLFGFDLKLKVGKTLEAKKKSYGGSFEFVRESIHGGGAVVPVGIGITAGLQTYITSETRAGRAFQSTYDLLFDPLVKKIQEVQKDVDMKK